VNPESRILNPAVLQRDRGKLASLNPESWVLNPAPSAGFTLFEMLLSLTLIGLLMVALLIGLRVASRAWRTGEARLRQVHTEGERNAFIVRQISSLVPYKVTLDDPDAPGTFVILQASPKCLRFVSSYSSVFRSHSGLVLAEYGITETSARGAEVALRESLIRNNDALFHRVFLSLSSDPDTGEPVINYQPFVVRTTDVPLMTGLKDAWFEYLDLHPKKDTDPPWRPEWKGGDKKPYPDAIRLRWELGDQSGGEVFPVRAGFVMPPPVQPPPPQ
jgi:prepilin-type N-terminal cleavage/methylation domain-containing protein